MFVEKECLILSTTQKIQENYLPVFLTIQHVLVPLRTAPYSS